MSLVSLLYVSSAVRVMAAAELQDLLLKSRRKNSALGVTGMLLHKDGNFMQVLEGEDARVRQVFDAICRDPRHTGLLVLRHAEAPARDFSDWSMAFADLDDPAVRATPGYSEFLNTPLTGAEFSADPTRCQKLLTTFKRAMSGATPRLA